MSAPKIVTSHVYPPIPLRQFDWCATFDDYDGAPDAGPQAVGWGATEEAAIADLERNSCPQCGRPNTVLTCTVGGCPLGADL